jgi:hypothetical protein
MRAHSFGCGVPFFRASICSIEKVPYYQKGLPHLSHRKSKLTAVLQDALCGHGKVLLVCNVVPEATEVE